MNIFKTAALMTLLTVLLLWAGAALGGESGLTIALIFALLMNVFSYWFSDKIVLKMYRAHEVSESDAPELFSTVRRLAQRAELPMPRVYIIDPGPAERLCYRQKPFSCCGGCYIRHHEYSEQGGA